MIATAGVLREKCLYDLNPAFTSDVDSGSMVAMSDTHSSNPSGGDTEKGGATATTAAPTDASHGFFGQPRSLANIFGVEMWERFSFYGMQGILLLYLYFSVAHGGLAMQVTRALPRRAGARIVRQI